MISESKALVPVTPLSRAALALVMPTEIVPVDLPDPRVAEGYLRLASHILLKAKDHPRLTFGVVSALADEGKTTAALNLAICLGRTRGRPGRILLVDGDTRDRTLSRLIVEASGATNGASTHHPLLQMTPYPGVDLLTAPSHVDRLALHDPTAWGDLLAALQARYPLILVDCPSILGNPEGLVLPASVDETLLVVRSGRTSREAVELAIESLEKGPMGVILNGGALRNAVASR